MQARTIKQLVFHSPPNRVHALLALGAVVVLAATVLVIALADDHEGVVVNNDNQQNVVVAGTSEPPPESVIGIQGSVGDDEACGTVYVPEPKLDTVMRTTDLAAVNALAEGHRYPSVMITAQAVGQDAVLLTGMRLVDLRIAPPPADGGLFSPACGGSDAPPRNFKVDLDRPNPLVRPTPVMNLDLTSTVPAESFPFKVSGADPEVFHVIVAREQPCDCRFALEVDWVVRGRAGSSRVDNGGAGFRLVVGSSVPAYAANGDTWVRK